MPVTGLRLEHLRCFEHCEVDTGGGPAILSGMNGSGKTTVLEALYLLARGRSFRTGHTEQLIRRGSKMLAIEAGIDLVQGRHAARLTYDQRIKVSIDRQPATIREMGSMVPTAFMDAEIAKIVLGGPEQRRKLLDWLMFHVEQEGWTHWKQYRRALRQWQWALRTGMEATVWIERMLEAVPRIEAARQRLIEVCQPLWQEAFETLFPDRQWKLEYHPGSRSATTLADDWLRWSRDRTEGTLAPGPHRAEIEISLEGIPARRTLSRGQAKLLSIGLMWGGANLLSRRLAASPLLLIDDFSSELDDLAQGRLLALLAQEPLQALVTTVRPPPKEATPSSYRLFHVEQGAVQPMGSC